ncbi:MAG: hypothetical protein WBZ36_21550 [Candidatus Nitrosopolaris sp.]
MIAGILIFYTIPYITTGWNTARSIRYIYGQVVWDEKESKPVAENAVLGLIAAAIALFIVSTILTFEAIFPLYTLYWFSIGGFIAIGSAAIIFIKVITMLRAETGKDKAAKQEAKDRKKALQTIDIHEDQTTTAAEEAKLREEERQRRRRSGAV